MPPSSRAFVGQATVDLTTRHATGSRGVAAILLPFGLFLVAVCAFRPILGNDFVAWDDDGNFLTNPHFRGMARANVAWAGNSPSIWGSINRWPGCSSRRNMSRPDSTPGLTT